MEKIIINAEGESLGRTASLAAKLALQGSQVEVMNCSKAVITGDKSNIIKNYMRKKRFGGHSQKGPYISANPEQIMKRTIRGMLPYKQGKGRDALKRIRCYNHAKEGIKTGKAGNKKGVSLDNLAKTMKGK